MLPLLQLSELEDQGRELADPAAAPEADLLTSELKRNIRASLDGLPADLREVLELRDIEQLRGEEVAAQLGISLSAMKSRLHRARGLLRLQLDSVLHLERGPSHLGSKTDLSQQHKQGEA